MGREEQIEEREVLSCIFPDEITGATPTGTPFHEEELTRFRCRHLRDRVQDINRRRHPRR
jgi:hypothetical protein